MMNQQLLLQSIQQQKRNLHPRRRIGYTTSSSFLTETTSSVITDYDDSDDNTNASDDPIIIYNDKDFSSTIMDMFLQSQKDDNEILTTEDDRAAVGVVINFLKDYVDINYPHETDQLNNNNNNNEDIATTTTTTLESMVSFVWNNSFVVENNDVMRDDDASSSSPPSSSILDRPLSNNSTFNSISKTKMIVFDKDGTLGDCNASMGRWVHYMVHKIQTQFQLIAGGATRSNNIKKNNNKKHNSDNNNNIDNNKSTTESSSSSIHQVLVEFYQRVGWDPQLHQVVPSAPVAAGTWDQIVEIVYQFLLDFQSELFDHTTTIAADDDTDTYPDDNDDDDDDKPTHIQETQRHKIDATIYNIAKEWCYGLDDLHSGDDPVIENLKDMMEECHRRGYLVGICTSDDRVSTDMAIKSWGIDKVVDVSICGDEVNGHGKPSAVPLQLLCQQATQHRRITEKNDDHDQITIEPHNCIMVGDTTADTGMAIAANVGFCVGVLTGSGTRDQLLRTGANVILPTVGDVPILLEAFDNMRHVIRKKSVSISG